MQAQQMCKDCKKSPEIKWKCITCDALLCKMCSTGHFTTKHRLSDLKEVGSENSVKQIRKLALKSMPCTSHGNHHCLYCTECNLPICHTCILQTHQPHKLCELVDEYDSKITEIKDLKCKIDLNIPDLENETKLLKTKLEEGEKQFGENQSKIREMETNMINLIHKYASELLKELESKWLLSKEFIQKSLSLIKQQEADVKKLKTELDDALESDSPLKIFTAVSKKNKDLLTYSMNTVQTEQTVFCPGHFFKESKSTVFGDVYLAPYEHKVETNFEWKGNANTILVTGSFNNWEERIPMQKKNNAFSVSIRLPLGEHHYKYIVDDNWTINTNQPVMTDEEGNENNVKVVRL